MPNSDFDSLGIDLEEFDMQEIDGDDELSILSDQRKQYEAAIETLSQLTGASRLYDIANTIDLAVSLAVEAFKTTNVSQFNSLESSKDEVSEAHLNQIIGYIVSQAYLLEQDSPNLYLQACFFTLLV